MSDTSPAERAPSDRATHLAMTATPETFPRDTFGLAQWLDKALASQAAQPAGADGWVMVPRQLTAEMLDTYVEHVHEHPDDLWSAMLAATPKAPATDAGEVEAFATAQADHWLEDMQTPALGAKHVSLKAMALNCINYGRALATPPAPNDDLRAALREARTTLSITRTNIMCEMQKGEGTAYRFEGVPEELKKRIDAIDAALKENRRG